MKEPIMSKASTNSAECIYPWEASGALLAEDATLVGPLFTRALRGAKAIREFYGTSGEVAGPLKVRWHMNKHVETFLIGSQVVGDHNVHSALWLKRDGAGRGRRDQPRDASVSVVAAVPPRHEGATRRAHSPKALDNRSKRCVYGRC